MDQFFSVNSEHDRVEVIRVATKLMAAVGSPGETQEM